jgi:hypothetical protein
MANHSFMLLNCFPFFSTKNCLLNYQINSDWLNLDSHSLIIWNHDIKVHLKVENAVVQQEELE